MFGIQDGVFVLSGGIVDFAGVFLGAVADCFCECVFDCWVVGFCEVVFDKLDS